jgi:hypothetical protein
MYSWKSHQQHEKKARQIMIYSGLFFGSVAGEIEGLSLDFHMCRICGSTIDEKPLCPLYYLQPVHAEPRQDTETDLTLDNIK